MSSGYTSDKANIAPAEPAAAWPIGGKLAAILEMNKYEQRKKKRKVIKERKKKKVEPSEKMLTQ